MMKSTCLVSSVLVAVLLIVLSANVVGASQRTPTDSFIVGTFRQRQTVGASYILEALHDLLGSNLCFTERDSTSLMQLCLEHGFRRLEVERFVAERNSNNNNDLVAKKQQTPTTTTRRSNRKTKKTISALEPMSGYLREEIENLFTAAASAPLDDAFSQPPSGDRRFASPFRSDYPRRDASALANITSEIYGRYDPSVSRLRVDHARGVATMVFPGGDPCYFHHEHDNVDNVINVDDGDDDATTKTAAATSWTTHLEMLCSLESNAAGRAASRHAATASGDPIKWDVRVNAPQCQVMVLIFTDLVC